MSLLEAPRTSGRHRYHGPEFVIPPSEEGQEFIRQKSIESMAVRRHKIESNIAATAIASVGEGLREKWNAGRRAVGNFATGLVARFRSGEKPVQTEDETAQAMPPTESVFSSLTANDLVFLKEAGIASYEPGESAHEPAAERPLVAEEANTPKFLNRRQHVQAKLDALRSDEVGIGSHQA